jgi:hypothetical protein
MRRRRGCIPECEPSIDKYDIVFPDLQILFSDGRDPDKAHLLAD